ncbi:hypothetical protein MA16_Dca024912 [Dendrobium catenatum]|uniref:Uncharacterized protein n=1 Tax=Dendrobium catenatum TaxID=906689 RepID=A0A2I0VI79_9ASPA|nr:hypothetical protein MA16_Dca024912 [Dendrobium catenatum]
MLRCEPGSEARSSDSALVSTNRERRSGGRLLLDSDEGRSDGSGSSASRGLRRLATNGKRDGRKASV